MRALTTSDVATKLRCRIRQIRAYRDQRPWRRPGANRSGTDLDLFLSLSQDTPETLSDIHRLLAKTLTDSGYTLRPQNVSIGIRVGNFDAFSGKRLSVSEPDLIAHCKGSLSSFNVPKRIDFVEQLPMSCFGKNTQTRGTQSLLDDADRPSLKAG